MLKLTKFIDQHGMRGDTDHTAKLGVAGKDGAHAIGHHKTHGRLVQGMVEPIDHRGLGVAGLLRAQGLQTQQVLRTTFLHKYGHMQIAVAICVEVAHPPRLHATSCLCLTQQNFQSLAFIGVKQLRNIAARQFAAEIFEQQNRPDLLEPELLELKVIEAYLPQQLTDEELDVKLKEILHYSNLKETSTWNDVSKKNTLLPADHQIGKAELLFAKIEDVEIEKQLEKLEASKRANEADNLTIEPQKEIIDFEDFTKLDIRIGTILEAVKVPKTKKLLKLKFNLPVLVNSIIASSIPLNACLNKSV